MITSCILTVGDHERNDMIEWLSLPNEIILKSERYENRINDVCLYYYKQTVTSINEDTLAFVRRSANELLRNKASKEALRKKLVQQSQTMMVREPIVDDMHGSLPMGEMIPPRQAYVTDVQGVDPNQLTYLMHSGVAGPMLSVSGVRCGLLCSNLVSEVFCVQFSKHFCCAVFVWIQYLNVSVQLSLDS